MLASVLALGEAGPTSAAVADGSASTGVDSSSAQGESLSPRINAAAVFILKSMRQTKYVHKSNIEEGKGIYDVDCSGLVDCVIKRVSPDHLAEIEKLRTHTRQLAEDYYEAFSGENAAHGWVAVKKVNDLTPGDILCWKLPPGSKNTGHVMIVAGKPTILNNKPDPAKDPGAARVYSVVIIDSTESPHGNDTRATGQTGIGRGVILVIADAADKPIGIDWSGKPGQMHPEQMAMGRAVLQK